MFLLTVITLKVIYRLTDSYTHTHTHTYRHTWFKRPILQILAWQWFMRPHLKQHLVDLKDISHLFYFICRTQI